MNTSPDIPGRTSRDVDDATLRALFSESPIGLHVLDTQLRLVRFNAAARHIRAFPVEDLLGCTVSEVLREYGSDQADEVEALVREVLETGRPRRDVLLTLRSLRSPYAEVAVLASWFRLQDLDGRPLGVAAAILDVTDRYQAQARLALLDRVGRRTGAGLDLFGTAQELAEGTVPDFADFATVDLFDPVLRGEAPEPGPLLGTIPLRRAGWCSHGSSVTAGWPVAGEVSGFPSGTPYRESLTDLRPRLVARLLPDAEWLDRDPVRGRLLRRNLVHSMIVVPMCARGVVLGLACFYRGRCPDPYVDEDTAIAAQLVARTALALDNVRLYNRERSAARLLQLSLRPPEVPDHTAVETAHSYLPSGSGGDWFDVIPLSGARVALIAGDTEGRGLRAAAAMGELRAAIGALADLDVPPDELLERLHDLVTRLDGEVTSGPRDDSAYRVVGTRCLYVVYDPVIRRCTMSSAGHLPPVIVRPDGTAELVDVPQGPPLGQGIGTHRTTERELPEGSILLLCNTALVQDRDPQQAVQQLERIRAALAPASRCLQDACEQVLRVLPADGPQHDPVLLMARTRAMGPDQVASWTLRGAPEAASEARRLTAGRLSAWGLDDLQHTTELVVSELVTNAVRYSDGPIGLRLIRDRTLICEVSDTSSTAPQLRHAEEDDESGRGLFITSRLTQRWGTRPARRGKTIWAELSLSA
ncbi:SpoIIE family protein phosphatase [Streptomyces sp. NPDC048527]|uniref:SpoIIE family protein phosphatase n=1 Tax=Streptomyces sp. NPDC048527 TaxID=3365568 RepID=UPI00370FCE3F